MSSFPQQHLPRLRLEYERESGSPFANFYCPILGVDEPAELCEGHIVSQKFTGIRNGSVVQRTDVDGWFGSAPEDAFVGFVEHEHTAIGERLTRKDVHRRMRPKILLDGVPVPHYFPRGEWKAVPGHTLVKLQIENGEIVTIVIKRWPDEIEACDIRVEHAENFARDAVVSLIKSAHLTMFYLFGYAYALRPAGQYVGPGLLGEIYRRHSSTGRLTASQCRRIAWKYRNMVKPLRKLDCAIGTLRDRIVLRAIGASGKPYADGVIVETPRDLTAVFIPSNDSIEQFLRFIDDPPKEMNAMPVRIDDYPEGTAVGPLERLRLPVEDDGLLD